MAKCVTNLHGQHDDHLIKDQDTLAWLFCCRCGKNLGENPNYNKAKDFEFAEKQGNIICDSPNVIGSQPFFNRGLGCYTDNTRHAEKIARQRGLTPIGDTPISVIEKERKRKTDYKSLLKEGIQSARAGKDLDGKPLKLRKVKK